MPRNGQTKIRRPCTIGRAGPGAPDPPFVLHRYETADADQMKRTDRLIWRVPFLLALTGDHLYRRAEYEHFTFEVL